MPVFLECQRCTACCRWPGQVRVSDDERLAIAGFLGMTEQEFINRHMRLADDRRSLVLADKPNGECDFLDGDDCRLQSVKPQQCRDFPNLWNFPGFEKVCHALPREVSEAEYRQRIARVTGRKPNVSGSGGMGCEP